MYGYIKVCAATVPIKVADVDFNTKQIINAICESSERGSQVTVFPELSLCGYTCGDLFNQRALLSAVENGISEIASATVGINTLVFIGASIEEGGKLYNCAVCISDGKILGVIPKSVIPNYGEFYELRHFVRAEKALKEITLAGQKVPFGTNLIFKADDDKDFTVACEICEDLWAPDSPSIRHAQNGANIIVNLSCSDETVGKAEYRRDLVKIQSAKLVCGYIYCDAGEGESTTDMAFSGHNLVCENGSVLAESALFKNGLLYSEIDLDLISLERRRIASGFLGVADGSYKVVPFKKSLREFELTRKYPKTPFIPKDLEERSELILNIQTEGLKKRLEHIHAKSAVIGISGGLDSALALLVTIRAFNALNKPLKDIIAVTMPCFGTSEKTKNNSLKLMSALGVTSKTINIKAITTLHFKDIGQDIENTDTTYENAQARIRTLNLMDIANRTGGIVIGTGDLSELALGWATYNGDHMSMYGVNSSVPKTLVKHLVLSEANRIGGECGKVLKDIINTEISPELLPSKDGKITQKTEDLVGPYILHDFFLYYCVRRGFSPKKILFLAQRTFKDDYDEKTVLKWLKLFYKRFFNNQFKRSCVPDGVKVGTVSLSPRGDWRMPSDAEVKIWLKELED